jgi:micrococcal nuclease
MKLRHYIAAVLLVPIILLVRFVVETGEHKPGFYTVVKVIDGDTVELSGHERLRLLGIDAPEYGEPYYDSAKAYLAQLAMGKQIRVEFGSRRRDGYGRLLGYIYIDSILINAEILRRGFAWMYLFPDNLGDAQTLNLLFAAQRAALADTAGVWRLPVFMPEPFYVGNMHSMRFHRPECSSVQGIPDANRVIYKTREEAVYDGYSPCRNCAP